MTRPTRFAHPYPQGTGIPGGDPTLPPGQPAVDCCDDDTELPDRALDLTVFTGIQSGSGALVQSDTAATNMGSLSLDLVDTVAGNLLVAVLVDRAGSAATLAGWSLVGNGGPAADDQGWMWWRVSPGGTVSVSPSGPTDNRRLYVMEFAGGGSGLVDVVTETAHAVGDPMDLGDVTVSGPATLVTFNAADEPGAGPITFTKDADFTEVDQGAAGGLNPYSIASYRSSVGAGTYDSVVAISEGDAPWGGVLAAFGLGSGWQGNGPLATDGDDATFYEISGENVIRIWLGAPFDIGRVRLFIGCENAGPKSYTLKGANAADFSDAVTVATIEWTATGSFTGDSVTESWASLDAYEFWELTGDDETRYLFSFELYESATSFATPSLDDVLAVSGGEDIADALIGANAPDAGNPFATMDDLGSDATGNVYTVEPQNVQSRQYLMRDGTWRDPFVTGDGVLTAGTIATITDDTKYNAWPQVVRLQDGRLMMAYTKGDSHNQDNTGNIVGKIGTVAYDGSVTWGTEFTIANETLGAINVGLGVTDTGRVIAAYNLYDFPATPRTPVDAVRVRYSDDDGTTWSSAYTVNTAFTSSCANGTSHLIQRRDGVVMLAVYGLNSGDTFWSASCFFSDDDGATWGDEVLIADGEADSRQYYEPSLTLLDDDRILCVIRNEDAGNMYQTVSTDGGLTWTAPAVAFAGYSPANAIQLSTGTLVSAIRGNAAAKLEAFVATDLGSGTTPPTWATAGILDSTSYTELEYACPVELPGSGGGLLVVYSVQPSAALTNADIKTVNVTEGLSTFAAGPAPATTVEDETTLGISPAVGTDLEYARQDHTHGTPDEDAIKEAGRWELAVIPGSPPDPLYDSGDFLYIWVPG